jgi:hypothetical protein
MQLAIGNKATGNKATGYREQSKTPVILSAAKDLIANRQSLAPLPIAIGTATLYHCITASLHHSITPLLHYSITPSLHYSITASLYHCITT